jgi:hypothetical protein
MEESTFGHMNEILEEIAAAPAPAEPVAKAR